ncbi:Tol-Pal system beta propeller repeat protein TolB [Roseomonas sp. CCTCC AB2023176]|uniref:Tol-Pal system beta propeller repeat protein TolB n=1 Tax=Roseomonas sp. CCTCC AB2023176 TaxID=3342640 RepID=UPI0035E37E4A
MTTGRRGLILGGAALLTVPATVRAQPAQGGAGQGGAVIDITRARTEPIPIAIPALAGGPRGADIARVIENNLRNSGLFRPVNNAAFIQSAEAAAATPRFQDWRVIGANALVTGRVEEGGGQTRVDFRLWDVLPEQQLQGTRFTTNSANWRQVAHQISDSIYERLLGEKGYFDTRIAYVAESGPRDRRVRRLAVMDQDGENNRILTDGSFQVLSPRFHPNGRQIVFMSYFQNQPRVYLTDITAPGRQEVLGNFPGMTLSPRFSPDGRSVVLSFAQGADANIYAVDIGSRSQRQLTSGGGLDVSPCYSPDGSQIVFNSDRGGDQQLYVMGAGGGGARRISFGRGRYATPVWSPRGDLIAFTRIAGGQFAIGVMRPDGTGERILSEGWQMEGPTFAPNGRVLAFYRESRAGAGGAGYSARLAQIDIAGFNERQMGTPTDATDPSWSPLLA